MTSENSGFDAGDFYDEGVKEAGIDQEEIVTDSPGEDKTVDVISRTAEDGKPDQSSGQQQKAETETEQAETKTEAKKEKAADSSAEDIQAAIESTETEPDSVIKALLPKDAEVEEAVQKAGEPDRTGKTVPVDDHIKLRRRAQDAERERDELREQVKTQTDGEKSGVAEKSPLKKFVEENPEEEIVPAKVQLEQEEFKTAQAKAKADAAAQKQEQQRQADEAKQNASDQLNAVKTKAKNSEVEFQKTHSDYNAVVEPIVKAKLLTDAERVEFLSDPNPAQKLYEICKAKTEAFRGVLGTPNNTPAKETAQKNKAPAKGDANQSTDDEQLTDDQIFDEISDIFPGPKEEVI